jgi:hypothetical protein
LVLLFQVALQVASLEVSLQPWLEALLEASLEEIGSAAKNGNQRANESRL